MPEITVIIPFYKKKKFFLSTIKSVLNQTYQNYEIIIIYDDKDKNDYSFLKKIKNLDKRIFLFKNKKNLGAGFSRNRGIKLAKGRFLAFIDADDIWHKDKLKKQIYFMKKKSLKISCTSFIITDQFGIFKRERIVEAKYSFEDILTDCPIGLSTVMAKKSIFNKEIMFPDLKTKEDYVLWLKISKFSHIYGIKSSLTYWRNVNNSLSKNIFQKLLDGYKVYRIHMNFSFLKSIYYLILLSINYVLKNR